jgi:hypothetical protein
MGNSLYSKSAFLPWNQTYGDQRLLNNEYSIQVLFHQVLVTTEYYVILHGKQSHHV